MMGLPNTSRIPRVVVTSFYLFCFFFPSLLKAISVTAELPVFCNVFFEYLSTILFNHFVIAMSIFFFEEFIYNTV